MTKQHYTTSTQLINSQFTVRAGDDDITINYDYERNEITIWINGEYIISRQYQPARATFNQVNLLDIASKYRTHYYRRKEQEEKRNSTNDKSQE